MNGFVQALRFLAIGGLTTGQVDVRMHAGDAGAQAIEVESKIAAGVERGEALIQRGKRCARIGGIRIGRQNTLGLQFRRQLLFDVAPAAVRIGRAFRTLVLLDPLDGIEGMGSMRARRARISLRCGGCARTRGALRRGPTRAHAYEQQHGARCKQNGQEISLHFDSSVESSGIRVEAARSSLALFSRPQRVSERVLSKAWYYSNQSHWPFEQVGWLETDRASDEIAASHRKEE